jgi:hypothetical protein
LESRDAQRIFRKLVGVKWISADQARLAIVEQSVVSLTILPVIAPMHATLVREPRRAAVLGPVPTPGLADGTVN